jgi:hypothetical protein
MWLHQWAQAGMQENGQRRDRVRVESTFANCAVRKE